MKADSANTGADVKVSVVIPTYNRAAQLAECIQSLTGQTLPAERFEVIVAVDGSTDETLSMLESLDTPFELRAVSQENRGQASALNAGARRSAGRFILFIDDDIECAPELVAAHLRSQEKMPRVVGLGRIDLRLPARTDRFTAAYGRRWAQHYGTLTRGTRNPAWPDCFSGNMSVLASEFQHSGGFDETIDRSFDIELGYRLSRQGLSFAYIPEARGVQNEHKKMRQLLRDSEDYGRSWIRLSGMHPPMIPALLGTLISSSFREAVAHQFLSKARLPYRLLALLGWFAPGKYWRDRWYRFLQNHAYWRGMRAAVPDPETWLRLTRGTLILLYHAVGGPEEPASRFVVPARRFDRQLAWLRRRGYQLIELEELEQCIREHRLPPARSVVITLDDGYADNHEVAQAILLRHKAPATVFLVSGLLGKRNAWDEDGELANRPLLAVPDAREMLSSGAKLGAHTRTHPVLTELTSARLEEELVGCREDLEALFDTPVRLLAYPFGEHNATVRQAARDSGYWASCTVDPGTNTLGTSPHALRRFEIKGTYSLLRFKLMCRAFFPRSSG